MQDMEIAIAKSAQINAEFIPVVAQKNVDWDAVIAFPPPCSCHFKEAMLGISISDGTKVIYGGHCVVAVLYYTHIFGAGIGHQRDERVPLV